MLNKAEEIELLKKVLNDTDGDTECANIARRILILNQELREEAEARKEQNDHTP